MAGLTPSSSHPSGAAAFVGCRVFNSAVISVGNAAFQALTFDSEDYDTSALHSTSANTGRITLTAGYWILGSAVAYAAAATNNRLIGLRKNGATFVAINSAPSNAVEVVYTVVSAEVHAADGDYYEAVAYQNSGGAINILAGAEYTPYFWASYLGS